MNLPSHDTCHDSRPDSCPDSRPWHTVPHNKDDAAYLDMLTLANEGLLSIKEATEQKVYQGGTLILPFLSEPKSSVLVAQAWKKLVDQHSAIDFSILPISASACSQTESELLNAGFPVYCQNSVLKAIKWDKLVRDGIIPITTLDIDNLPKGRKGRTLLAGTLLSLRQNPNGWVMFHDADVLNPEEYGALAAIIGMLGNKKNNACLMALIGPERHNEQWTAHANIVANTYGHSQRVKKIAQRLGRIVWPLSGERGFSADWVRKLPFALGMGIETILDVASCEKEFDNNNTTYIQQIVGNVTKAERGTCDVRRENALITACTLFLARLLEYLNQANSRPLWGLDLEGATILNSQYSGTEVDIFVQPGEPGAQSVERIRRETILPCIDELDAGGYIDWRIIDVVLM